MTFDIIVFSQEELTRALDAGIKSIALCDNSFSLPDIEGVHYTIMGGATIEGAPKTTVDIPQQSSSSYTGSFGGSFSGSYALGSYSGSMHAGSGSGVFMYEYEYEFGGSYTSSYASSYQSLYISSYATSYNSSYLGGMSYEWGASNGFSASYGYVGSYADLYGIGTSHSSYTGSMALPYSEPHNREDVVYVNGYGINLI